MTEEEFAARAAEMWAEIPGKVRAGVSGLSVAPQVQPHPRFERVHTLGECLTDTWPDGFGEGEVQSSVVLYHGSFAALAAMDPAFDWKAEMWETILHELLHHREAAAGQYGLDVVDWAEEQNYRRLAGEDFDAGFYRAVPAGADGIVRLDSSMFLEVEADEGENVVSFRWRGEDYSVNVPRAAGAGEGNREFVDLDGIAGGRLCLVVRRFRRRWWQPRRDHGGRRRVGSQRGAPR